jgi:hypothetical protein
MPPQPPANEGEDKDGEQGGQGQGGQGQGGQGQGGQGQGGQGQGGQGQGGQFGTSKQDAGSAELQLPSKVNPCVDPQGLRNC